MRTFGTGGRLADVEARIEAEMRAASAEDWILTDTAGLGDASERCCCPLGAVGRDRLMTVGAARHRTNGLVLVNQTIRERLGVTAEEFSCIASGFDGETFDPDTNEHVHLGRRLRVLADQLNLERVRRAGAST